MMTKEFIRYLKYGEEIYDSDPFAPSEDGGFLIPRRVDYYKPGLMARIWRFLGREFRNKILYEKGIKITYPQKNASCDIFFHRRLSLKAILLCQWIFDLYLIFWIIS